MSRFQNCMVIFSYYKSSPPSRRQTHIYFEIPPLYSSPAGLVALRNCFHFNSSLPSTLKGGKPKGWFQVISSLELRTRRKMVTCLVEGKQHSHSVIVYGFYWLPTVSANMLVSSQRSHGLLGWWTTLP